MTQLQAAEPGLDRLAALAESLASRLCHDVAGLAATIAGTLEMALEDSPADAEAASLATEATTQLAARLRLYRAAWGGGDTDEDGVAALLEGLPNRTRLRLTIAPEAADRLDGTGTRLLLCVLLAATAAMPLGGEITAEPDGPGFAVTLTGRNAAWPPVLALGAPALAACLDTVGPRDVAAPLAAIFAGSVGWQLRLDAARLVAWPLAGG